MAVEEIFSTEIIKTVIHSVDLDRVENACLKVEKEYESTHRSNLFGYQSPSTLFHSEDLRFVLDEITASVRGILNRDVIEQNAWVNINKMNGMNKKHSHPQSYRSAVLYVTDAYSSIRFFDPRPAASHVENSPCYSFQPKRGDILIFPAWLEHDVEPNMTNNNRITIACNYGHTQ